MSFTLPFTIDEPNEFDLSWPSALEYIGFMKGPIASTGLSQLTGIVSSIYTTPDDPDLQIFFGGYQAACATTGQVGALMDNGGRHVSISPTNLHPRSRGTYVFLRVGEKKKKDCSVFGPLFVFRYSSVGQQRSLREAGDSRELLDRPDGRGRPPPRNPDSLVAEQHVRPGQVQYDA